MADCKHCNGVGNYSNDEDDAEFIDCPKCGGSGEEVMTIRQTLEQNLIRHGLWDNEAKNVIDRLSQRHPEMQGRWDEDTEGYPTQLLAILVFSSKDEALRYLKETKPLHFAIAVLEAK